MFEKSVLPVTTALFFLAVAYGGITTFLPLFAESIRVNAGTFFLVYAIALTVVRPLAGKLSDWFQGVECRGSCFLVCIQVTGVVSDNQIEFL